MPCFWISLWITLILILLAMEVKNTKAKVIIANLTAIPLAIFIGESIGGIFETYKNDPILYKSPEVRTNQIFEYRKYIGFVLRKNVSTRAYRKFGDYTAYNVIYTADKNGLRLTPSSNDKSDKCIMFFGCSFVYGVGLNDNETLPYLFGISSNKKYKIYNFGMGGYGPHQMLSMLEHGSYDNLLNGCKENTAVYVALSDHARRIAGLTVQGKGPKYALVNNEAIYQGNFDDAKTTLAPNLEEQLNKSEIYKYLKDADFVGRCKLAETNVYYKNLFIAILKKSKKIFKEKYRTNRFIIIYWDWNPSDAEFGEKIKKNSMDTYFISDILPEYWNNQTIYHIKYDNHPNKLANEKIADFLAKKLDDKK